MCNLEWEISAQKNDQSTLDGAVREIEIKGADLICSHVFQRGRGIMQRVISTVRVNCSKVFPRCLLVRICPLTPLGLC